MLRTILYRRRQTRTRLWVQAERKPGARNKLIGLLQKVTCISLYYKGWPLNQLEVSIWRWLLCSTDALEQCKLAYSQANIKFGALS